MLGFTNDATLAGPTVLSRVLEFLVEAGGLTRLLEFLMGLLQRLLDLTNQHRILGQADHVVHTIAFAPGQDLFSAKSRSPPAE